MSDERTQAVLSDIRERLVRVETKLDDLASYRDLATEANKIAIDAKQRANSAHHRIDKIDKIMFWAGTTIVGTVIVALIGLAMRGR